MALINKMNILKVWLNVVMFNRPPYIDTPASKGLIYKLLNASKAVNIKLLITILENNIDLSRLIVTAFENNNNTNKDINIVLLYESKSSVKKVNFVKFNIAYYQVIHLILLLN